MDLMRDLFDSFCIPSRRLDILLVAQLVGHDAKKAGPYDHLTV